MTRTLNTLTCAALFVMATVAAADAQDLGPYDANSLIKIAVWSKAPPKAEPSWTNLRLRSDGTWEVGPSDSTSARTDVQRAPRELRRSVRGPERELRELLEIVNQEAITNMLYSVDLFPAMVAAGARVADGKDQSVITEAPSVLEYLNEKIVISRFEAPRLPLARDILTAVRQLVAAAPAMRGARRAARVGRYRVATQHDFGLAPSASRQVQPNTKTAAALPRLRMLFVSLGVTTGEAFQAEIVNDGPGPISIDAMQLVLEPLTADEARRAAGAIRALRAKRPTMARITGYCLDFAKQPPKAGTIYRVAPLKTQQQSDPVRRILHASRMLRAVGALTPDSDSTSYFHSIRQWAIWTLERKLTLDTFTQAYIEHTKKIFKAARRPWTAEAEDVLRNAAPGRWRDIEQVLREADRLRTAAE